MSTLSRRSLRTAKTLAIVPAIVSAIVALGACDSPPEYQTEKRQFGLDLEGLGGHLVEAPATEVHVVAQTRMCPVLGGWFDTDGFHIRGDEEDDAWLRECVTLGSSGQAHLDDDGCLVTDAPGTAALELTAMACDTSTFTDDRLPVLSHAVTDLAVVYDDSALRRIRSSLHPGPATAFPPAPTSVPGDPVRVVAGADRPFVLQPVRIADARPIAFSDARVVGGPPAPNDFGDGVATLTLAVDETLMLSLELPAGTLVGEPILGVAASDAATLEMLVGYAPCAACDDGFGEPIAATVIVRDAEGRRMHSPDVQWNVEGDSLPLGDMAEPGAITFETACTDIEGAARSSTLLATFEGLSASAEIAYTCPDPEQLDKWEVDIIDDDNPETVGCLCNAGTSGGPGAWSWLVLLPLLRRSARGQRITSALRR